MLCLLNALLGDDLKTSITPKSKVKIAASYFSIYAYEALKAEARANFMSGRAM